MTNEEINSLIAQKVFGYKLYEGEDIPKDLRHLREPVEGRSVWVRDHTEYFCSACGSLPNYCGEIEQAWKVMNKIVVQWQGRVEVSVTNVGMGEWECNIVALTGHGRMGYARATTAPKAICDAALRAEAKSAGD